MKKSKAFMLTAMAAAMAGETLYGNSVLPEQSRKKPKSTPVFKRKERIPPKETKTYFFDEYGDFSTDQMKRSECVFKCFAINDKSAMRKFKNWSKNK